MWWSRSSLQARYQKASQGWEELRLITGVDLNQASDQQKVRQYFIKFMVLCVVVAPASAPFGPLGISNKEVHPQAWERSYNQVAPHGRFCGEIALLQLQKGLHFLCEHPDVLQCPGVGHSNLSR